jgi:hypothetical protein
MGRVVLTLGAEQSATGVSLTALTERVHSNAGIPPGRKCFLLMLVYLEICGPLETVIGGGRYMLLFMDDAMRHMEEFILKYKSEALEKFQERKAFREKESGNQVMRFRTDGRGEYTSQTFAEYLKKRRDFKGHDYALHSSV